MKNNKMKVIAFVVLMTFLMSNIGFAAVKPLVSQMGFYEKVKIGMTKKAVEKALGVKGKLVKDDFTRPNTYTYDNKKGKYGVRISYVKGKVDVKHLRMNADWTVLAPYCENYVMKSQAAVTYRGVMLEDVIALFGATGVEVGNESNDQITRVWYNSDGSNVTAYYESNGEIYNLVYVNSEGQQDSDVSAIYEN